MQTSQNMPNFQMLKYVKLGYQYLVNHLLTFLLVPIMATAAVELLRMRPEEILRQCHSLHLGVVQILCSSLFITLIQKSVEFQVQILERSGLGERTCVSPALHYIPPDPTIDDARAGAELIIFYAVMRMGIKPQDVDILIVNCSLPIAIDLARHLLQVHANEYAVVVSTEIIFPNWYSGNQRSMLLPKSYRCVFQEEDAQGMVGISLSKDLMAMAGEALKSNITTMGPIILNLKLKPYIPDFKNAFEHFCIHAGGKALSPEHVEASRMTLHRFGNTSSSSLWYEMSYIEAKGRMKKGDRVWQIMFGSGFKCNSAVWKCNRSIKVETDGPWADCIEAVPISLSFFVLFCMRSLLDQTGLVFFFFS
ncbi:hypothetical protein AMTRI_Chr13g84190 [Amborella trichopoda]